MSFVLFLESDQVQVKKNWAETFFVKNGWGVLDNLVENGWKKLVEKSLLENGWAKMVEKMQKYLKK